MSVANATERLDVPVRDRQPTQIRKDTQPHVPGTPRPPNRSPDARHRHDVARPPDLALSTLRTTRMDSNPSQFFLVATVLDNVGAASPTRSVARTDGRQAGAAGLGTGTRVTTLWPAEPL